MLTDEMRAEGWREHDGGPCPAASGAWIWIMFRGGIIKGPTLPEWWGGTTSERDNWRHFNDAGDIIAYKPENPDG